MKITVGRHSGFCFGVKRAYDLACINSKNCTDIFILGRLVHNDDVCRDLKKRGGREIKSVSDVKDGTLIFTAHGIGPSLYEKASERSRKIIDTTCPKVVKAQRLAKNYAEKGCLVIIFGDKKHKEVKGIREWSKNKAKIVGSCKGVKKLKLEKNKKYCLIAQTTQNVEEFKKIRKYLSQRLRKFICLNTICDSTDNRQEEVRKLAENNDAVIVIGGRHSANSQRLFEISKQKNTKTFFIENARQLKKKWFNDIKKIAISAGASTPKWVIGEGINKIKDYSYT